MSLFPEFEFQGLLSQKDLDLIPHLTLPKDNPPETLLPPPAPEVLDTSFGAVETVGRAFFRRLRAHHNIQDLRPETTDGRDNEVDEKVRALQKKFDINREVDLEDYYTLLGLEETHVFSTDEQIEEAFRVATLYCHPDKALPKQREYAEARFKALQRGYEILRDPAQRRVYDSSLPFDESIPSGLKPGQDFYEVFGPVFERNSRFSTVRPVPQLGDDTLSYEDTLRFYDFWFSFKSWREFAHEDEHVIDDQVSREEKRWMLRQNEKLRRAKKREEMARIRSLVERAQQLDPRIRRHVAEQKAKKEAAKRAREEEKRRQEEERRRKEEEERLAEQKRQEEEQKRRAQNKNIRQAVRNAKKEIRKRSRQLESFLEAQGFDEITFSDIVGKFDLDGLTELRTALVAVTKVDTSNLQDPAVVKLLNILRGTTEAISEEEKTRQEELERARKAEEEKQKKLQEAKAAPWSQLENELLQRALQRFPIGSLNRHQNITAFLNTEAKKKQPDHFPREEKDVVKKLKMDEIQRHEAHLDKVVRGKASDHGGEEGKEEADDEDVWTVEQQQNLEAALKTVPKSPTFWEEVAEKVQGKTVEQVKQRVKEIREQLLKQQQQK